ncbi:hypothetical protein ACTOB_007913 [Actinoplanes oblitus]|uniref:Uncharacterized protein n=1 Tax=Actinoplanes oblitus TaxID=3040509 RepID=A0ABY8WE56_9ACTN|nr:hypothetical protein [Actinoplanes oblitus]WIM95782.1 hypothetical protein ACTOB_007913 [Actinoplanes oblitus]
MDDGDETRDSAGLLNDLTEYKPLVYVWRGQTLQGSMWVPADPPEGGDSIRLGALDMREQSSVYDLTDDDVRYLEIRATAWGDYTGSTYDRSNARSIRRDFGDHVITLRADFGFEVLLVRIGVDIPEGLYDAIVGLRECSLYDESDLSDLESELESEDWANWGRSDWTGEVRKLAQQLDQDDDVTELHDDAYADDLFWAVCADGEAGYWQAETAVSGYWSDFERAAKLAWQEIERRRMAALEEWARELSAPIPGQLALAI